MALYLLRKGVNREEPDEIGEACQNAEISIEYQNGEQIVLLDGENVNAHLRTEEVSAMASVSSAVPRVREKLLDLQRKLAMDHERCHGRQRYRNNDPAGCRCQDLSYRKLTDKGTSPLS